MSIKVKRSKVWKNFMCFLQHIQYVWKKLKQKFQNKRGSSNSKTDFIENMDVATAKCPTLFALHAKMPRC